MTTTEVINFDFRNNDVRVIEKDGEPWFVAADVCRALEITSPWNVYGRLRLGKEKCYIRRTELGLPNGKTMLAVTEPGLYKLIMRSDKPEAHAFQDWVTGTVLPSIRKNGGYISGQEQHASGQMDDATFMAQALQVANRVLEDNKRQIEAQAQQIEKLTSS